MKPSRRPIMAPSALPANDVASEPGAVRSDQSLSVVKARPMFCACPEKLKPRILTICAVSGCLST
ncbi:hypothetical protein D3C72_1329450 [compost metagenome]